MAEQFFITKRDMEFQVNYSASTVTIIAVKCGGCTQDVCELIARSYQAMAQYLLSANPISGDERYLLIAFFERKTFSIKENIDSG